MNLETENLILEHLHATRADMGTVRDDVRDRLQRIERRREFTDAPS